VQPQLQSLASHYAVNHRFSSNKGLSYSDPSGLKECDKATGEGCSDEFKRLLKEDKALESPLVDRRVAPPEGPVIS
jgi:hypothetical protein